MNTTSSYGPVAKFFHWLIFLLVAGMLLMGYLMDDISDKTLHGNVMNIHKLLGLLILALMVLRLLWAIINVKPALPFNTPLWQQWLERGMHFLLYLVLLLMPISGWVGSVAGGRPPHLAGFNFSLPVAQNKSFGHFLFHQIHDNLAIIIIVLVSLHMCAALYHHFIKRDAILRRMMPDRR